ncbi:RraA family protein [soil metagenome]
MAGERSAAYFEKLERQLYTPVLGDILDGLGHTTQFLPAGIRSMRPGMPLAGRAFPVTIADTDGAPERPFGLLTDAVDALAAGDVYIASGGRGGYALWGELLTAAARARGARGAVVNGNHRDTPQVLEQSWPVYSEGGYAQDISIRGEVVAFGEPIRFGAVSVARGDLVFADDDGVLIVPAEVEDRVVALALEKASTESEVRSAIEGGMTVTEAFRTFGVL